MEKVKKALGNHEIVFVGTCVSILIIGLIMTIFVATRKEEARRALAASWRNAVSEAKTEAEGQIALVSNDVKARDNVYHEPEWVYTEDAGLEDISNVKITHRGLGEIIGKANGVGFKIISTVTDERNGIEKSYRTEVLFDLNGDEVPATVGTTVIQTKRGLATETQKFFSGDNYGMIRPQTEEDLNNPPKPIGAYIDSDANIALSKEQFECIKWVASHGDGSIPYSKEYIDDDWSDAGYKFVPAVTNIEQLI